MSVLIFDLDVGPDSSGHALSRLTGWPLAPLEWRTFEDGEFKLRPMVDVRGQHVVVIARTAHDIHNRIIALAILLSALRRQEAQHVSVVMPSLPYARKDRATQARDPVSLQWLARVLEVSGMDALWTFESHNPAATDNAFRCAVHGLDMTEWLGMTARGHSGLDSVTHAVDPITHAVDPVTLAVDEMIHAVDAVIAPDAGGVRRALALREALRRITSREIGFAMMDKRRAAGVVGGDPAVVGEVAGLRLLVVDDLISSGMTLARAATALAHAGAQEVHALIAHGRPGREVLQRLREAGLRTLTLSDSQAQQACTSAKRVEAPPGVATTTRSTETDASVSDMGHRSSDQGMTVQVLPVMPLIAQRMLQTFKLP